MTKRICPYETNVFRQCKIHINNYENDMNALKELEGVTMKKLIDGTKKLYSAGLGGLNCGIMENMNFTDTRNCNKKLLQKCVTNYFTVNGKLHENDNCNVIPFSATSNRCFFCENSASSLEQCTKCLEFYCNSCSFTRYESSLNESRICISCI